MPILGLQQRIARTGAIRLGNMITQMNADGTPVMRNGKPVQYPNKLDTFRVTSPHRDTIEAVAQQYGGTVAPWHGPKGPEWEVVTSAQSLPVLVPAQHIDTNFEFWGNKVRNRLCDGGRERLRGKPCLCQQWDDHTHRYAKSGNCMFCGISRDWSGEPHTHQFDLGACVICGAGRICKPTTRVNVMIQAVPGIGVFKVESHGFTAAAELPALTEMISSAPMPLPATVVMRYEDRPYFNPRTDKVEARQFWVPELKFTFATPEVLWYGSGGQLAAASRSSVTAGPVLQALTAAPEPAAEPDEPDTSEATTAADIYRIALQARTLETVQELWRIAQRTNLLDKPMSKALADRAAELAKAEPAPAETEIVEGDIVDS